MSNLTELTAQIIAARAANREMSTEELQHEMQMVYSFLKNMDDGTVLPVAQESTVSTKPQKINLKQYFKKDEVICIICNKGFKTLKRHLTVVHDLKPGEYKKQFGIPSRQSLVAKAYSEKWRQAALDRGQGEILAKARAVRAAKNAAVPAAKSKTPVPAVKVKAAVPAVKIKTPVPAVKIKAVAPAKKEATEVPKKAQKSKGVTSTPKSRK
ncbi:MAG TPA: MucR family transcriptional regulator [Dongiaceae bacterium]|nr:MucR family transcriptional regulator [Dongiaceae bacterium]